MFYPYPFSSRIYGSIVRSLTREINGLENIPVKKPAILAINHNGLFDPIFIILNLVNKTKQKIHFLSGKGRYWLLSTPWLASLWAGSIGIDPYDKAKALEKAIKFLRKGKIVALFVEGQNNPSRLLLKGKTGAARLTLATHVPVIPIGIKSPPGESITKSVSNFWKSWKRVIINIGKPREFPEYYKREIDYEILEEVTRRIMKEIGRLCGKEYPY